MKRSEFIKMIQEAAGPAITSAVEDAVSPLKQQQTDWMAKFRDNSEPRVSSPYKKGMGAGRFVRALAFANGDMDKAVYFAKKAWNDSLGDSVQKALAAGTFSAGGALIPPEFAAEIIELLRARSVVRSANPRILPMNSGSLTLRKQTGASTASYVGESQNITSTQPTTGQIVMTSKKLAALVPISNDLLTFAAGDSADEFVRDDLVLSLATREDQAFIRDDGTEDKPKGMRFWAVAANVQASAGTLAADVETDFKTLVNDLEQSNVKMIRPAWFMAPRSKNHLLTLREAQGGNLVFPTINQANPTLYGWPVFISTNIPTNLGGGTETEVYLVDMIDAVIAESTDLEIAVDSSASYIDGSTLVSAFARDETLMRAISRHDFAMRHAESVSVVNTITWGA